MALTLASLQGGRASMEDRVFSVTRGDLSLLCVFDGHGGEAAADACVQVVQTCDLAQAQANGRRFLHDLVSAMRNETRDMECGTTASLVLVSSRRRYAAGAFLGDSPIFVKAPGGSIRMQILHSVSGNDAERTAAEARGGECWPSRNGTFLSPRGGRTGRAVTRALGDADMGRVLSREPEFISFPLSHRKGFVLAASDGFIPDYDAGFFDINDVAAKIGEGCDAWALMNWRRTFPMSDNASIALWTPS